MIDAGRLKVQVPSRRPPREKLEPAVEQRHKPGQEQIPFNGLRSLARIDTFMHGGLAEPYIAYRHADVPISFPPIKMDCPTYPRNSSKDQLRGCIRASPTVNAARMAVRVNGPVAP
jgi:hypothetical protein